MAGMRNSLQLRTAQTLTLTMTPQLQQAIRLLQLTTLEVRQEISQMLERNPLLEETDSGGGPQVQSLDALRDAETARESVFDPFDNDSSAHSADLSLTSYVYASPDGAQAHDELSSLNAAGETSPAGGDSAARFDDFSTVQTRRGRLPDNAEDSVYEGQTEETLRDHLLWQLNCSPLTERDRAIAEAIIDGVDDSGYLSESLEDLEQALKPRYADIETAEIQAVLKVVQHFDPLGAASRSVQEYLLIQLNELPKHTPLLLFAKRIVQDYLPLLASRDFRRLRTKLKVSEETLKRVISLITSLNQRPGQGAVKEKADFIIPDLLAVKTADGYEVINNPSSTLPHLRINRRYAELARSVRSERDRAYLQNSKQEANYFIKSLENRRSTVLTIAKCIMSKQRGFLEHGESALRPLTLRDIAEEVNLHESTVSRAASGKYIQTPRGTYELKYFFSSRVETDDGAASAAAIRAQLKELIGSEDPRHPLSDAALTERLQQQGISVARRTVAKYRESLNIPSSSQRRRLI